MNLSEEQSLLLAVRNDADSDVPRLVYADWLEERGEVDHAVYIRKSIELVNAPYRANLLPLMLQLDELHSKIEYIHSCGDDNIKCVVHRGFIREVTLTHRDIVDDECPVCSGVGYWAEGYPPQEQVFCDRCESTGKNDIFQRWLGLLPLKRINVSDKRPMRSMTIGDISVYTFTGSQFPMLNTRQDMISPKIFAYMKSANHPSDEMNYTSVELANNDLSQACIKFLRNKFDTYHTEVTQ